MGRLHTTRDGHHKNILYELNTGPQYSDKSNLVSNIQSIMVGSQSYVSFLFSIGTKIKMSITTQLSMKEEKEIPNESVHFGGLDIIQFLHSILDLTLIGLDVDDEHKRIMLLNLLHCRLRIQWPIITFAYTIPSEKEKKTYETIVLN